MSIPALLGKNVKQTVCKRIVTSPKRDVSQVEEHGLSQKKRTGTHQMVQN